MTTKINRTQRKPTAPPASGGLTPGQKEILHRMLEELAAQGKLRRGKDGAVTANLKAAIAELALGNSFFAGLKAVMPPAKSKLYDDLYN